MGFITLPATTPKAILGFTLMVVVILLVLAKTGVAKKLGIGV
jgi:hypothetical protein